MRMSRNLLILSTRLVDVNGIRFFRLELFISANLVFSQKKKSMKIVNRIR